MTVYGRSRLYVALGLAALALAGCTGRASSPVSTTSATPSSGARPSPTVTVPSVPLVRWTGPVEHLFFHTLVIRPELAFSHDRQAKGYRDYFVTVGEFKAILGQLYANGWTLVDIHRAVAGQVEVPAGRRPLVLSVDDVNYYDAKRARGLGWRLVLDPAGDVKVEERDDQGIRATDNDIVPIVDAFVAAHALFSADGAKGVLALTGYEGLFGERVNDQTAPDLAAAVARATALAVRLRATGWILASHSFGHIDLSKLSTAQVRSDAEQWLAEATPVIGPTDIYVYPLGASPHGAATIEMLASLGFTVLCDIDKVPRLVHTSGVAIMSRRHIDGIAFHDQVAGLAPFFDVTTVEDTAARKGP